MSRFTPLLIVTLSASWLLAPGATATAASNAVLRSQTEQQQRAIQEAQREAARALRERAAQPKPKEPGSQDLPAAAPQPQSGSSAMPDAAGMPQPPKP